MFTQPKGPGPVLATGASAPFIPLLQKQPYTAGYLPDALVARKIEHGEVIVSEVDGVPVGYARIEYLWSQRPFLSVIRVIEQHRRQGVGERMLTYLAEMLKASGYSALLSSSQVDEPEPQAWHRRMGFRECGIINGVNDGGVGEVFFTKDL